jgi:hypothetical protein
MRCRWRIELSSETTKLLYNYVRFGDFNSILGRSFHRGFFLPVFTWRLFSYVQLIETPIVDSLVNDLPTWPTKSGVFGASEYSSKKHACLNEMCRMIKNDKALSASPAVQSFFARRPSGNETASSGVLYLGLASARTASEPDSTLFLRLQLMENFVQVHQFDDSRSLEPNNPIYRCYNAFFPTVASQFVRLTLLDRNAGTKQLFAELFPIALKAYQNYDLKVPLRTGDSSKSVAGHPKLRVCFIPIRVRPSRFMQRMLLSRLPCSESKPAACLSLQATRSRDTSFSPFPANLR